MRESYAAVEEAHRLGLPVTAHTHATAAIRAAVDAGVDGMEHVSFWSADGVDEPGELVEIIAKRGIALGATVGIVPVPGAMPPAAVRERMPRIIGNFRRLVAAGAVVAAPGSSVWVIARAGSRRATTRTCSSSTATR